MGGRRWRRLLTSPTTGSARTSSFSTTPCGPTTRYTQLTPGDDALVLWMLYWRYPRFRVHKSLKPESPVYILGCVRVFFARWSEQTHATVSAHLFVSEVPHIPGIRSTQQKKSISSCIYHWNACVPPFGLSIATPPGNQVNPNLQGEPCTPCMVHVMYMSV